MSRPTSFPSFRPLLSVGAQACCALFGARILKGRSKSAPLRGCAAFLLLALLGLTPPVSAQEKPKDADVIYPRNAAAAASPANAPAAAGRPDGGMNGSLLVLGGAAAAAGGWLLWRQRRSPSGFAGRAAGKLAIAESRSLGNRQYLVVADYDGRKFLLGVCPGRIDLLSPLDERPADPKS